VALRVDGVSRGTQATDRVLSTIVANLRAYSRLRTFLAARSVYLT
jgi:hypothetical protein